MIERTLFAVSTDETRLNLSGVLLEAPENGKLRIVATDGHRLEHDHAAAVEGATAAGVIIPRKGVVEVSKVIEVGDEAGDDRTAGWGCARQLRRGRALDAPGGR